MGESWWPTLASRDFGIRYIRFPVEMKLKWLDENRAHGRTHTAQTLDAGQQQGARYDPLIYSNWFFQKCSFYRLEQQPVLHANAAGPDS